MMPTCLPNLKNKILQAGTYLAWNKSKYKQIIPWLLIFSHNNKIPKTHSFERLEYTVGTLKYLTNEYRY